MTPADLKCDIASGKKPREFLGQSVGLENELVGQTFSPCRARTLARGSCCLPADCSGTSQKNLPDRRLQGQNMPEADRVRQGGKLWPLARRASPLVELLRSGEGGFAHSGTAGASGLEKGSLTLFRLAYGIHGKFSS